MNTDYSSVGAYTTNPAPPAAPGSKGSDGSGFVDDLMLELDRTGADSADDADSAEYTSNDDDRIAHDKAAHDKAAEDALARRQADDRAAEERAQEDRAAEERAEQARQAGKSATGDQVDEATVHGDQAIVTTQTTDGDQNDTTEDATQTVGTDDQQKVASPDSSDVSAAGTAVANSDGKQPEAATQPATAATATTSQTATPDDKGTEAQATPSPIEKAGAAPEESQSRSDKPLSEDALLAALQDILGSEDAELLNAIRTATPDELPALLTMSDGTAAAGGATNALAHVLTKRINTLQERLDRLQQLLSTQQGSGASLDPALSSKLGLTESSNVSDVITTIMRQTEQRLDALMNGNARAAAAPTTSGSSGDGSFSSQLNADAASGSGQSTAKQAAAAQAGATAPRAAPPQTNAGIQVAIQLTRAAQDGLDRISIRLNPAELGRVDVKLELGHDGRTIAVVTAERQETLDLLQRDARGLERALQEAGLKADSNSLSFNLRQQGQDSGTMARHGGGNNLDSDIVANDDELTVQANQVVDPNRLLDISV